MMLSQWMKEAGCKSQHSQLDSDLNQWSAIDFEKVLTIVKRKWANPEHRYTNALCHYQIVENNVNVFMNLCYGFDMTEVISICTTGTKF